MRILDRHQRPSIPMQTRIHPLDYRRAIGRFPTGVAVVTVPDHSAALGVHGITVSSLTSVSLDPLLLLVSIAKKARSHDLVARSGRFALSVLARDQEDVSDYYAGRPVVLEAEPLEEFAGHLVVSGALSHLACSLHAAIDAGDHTVYIGRVEALRSRDDGAPLVYYRGRYRPEAAAALQGD